MAGKQMGGCCVVVAAAVGAGGMRAANAAVTVGWVPTVPNPAALALNGAQMNTLVANGWACYLLIATADGSSQYVAGWDFATPASRPGQVSYNRTAVDWGIYGILAQRWSMDPTSGDFGPSNYGATSSQSGGFANTPDSFFYSSALFNQLGAPLEDNNLANGTANPPYDHNPNLSSDAFAFGVGTYMKALGAMSAQGAAATQVIAQVWVPAGTGVPYAAGVVTDARGMLYFIAPIDLPPPGTPAEPGSLAMLGLGAAMLAKRRAGVRRAINQSE